jgi:hypothetical protein
VTECSEIRTRTVLHRAGVRCILGGLAGEFVKAAPELVWQRTESEAVQAIVHSIECNDRYEIWLLTGDRLIGMAVVVPDDDDHVGACLSVQWRFVLEEYRYAVGTKLQRAIKELARSLNYNIVAYTQRTGLGTYSLRYTKVRYPDGQED